MRYLQEKRFAKMRKGCFENFCEENNENILDYSHFSVYLQRNNFKLKRYEYEQHSDSS